MAGRVVISTLNDDTGVLAARNGMTGIAKAWVNFNGTGTPAIRGSFNVSSITDNGTGDYTINFTTAMPNTNYAISGSKSYSGITNANSWWVKPRQIEDILTTSVRIHSGFTSGTGTDFQDSEYNAITIFSS